MNRAGLWAACGAILGAFVVIGAMFAGSPGWGFFAHTTCQLNEQLGNVTVWFPAAVVAAPYHGWESGLVTIWGTSPLGRATLSQPTSLSDGNVSAFFVDYVNFTVYSNHNVTLQSPGVEAPCPGPMSALLSPNAAGGLRSGGTAVWPLYANLMAESGLSNQLNGSQLCRSVENSTDASCAFGAEFDFNFQRSTGVVDTCGLDQSQQIRLTSQAWALYAPFSWNDHAYSVPIDISGTNSATYSNGTYAWYNYTFPANGGVWQYDNLAETSSTGAGLVFSYSPCP